MTIHINVRCHYVPEQSDMMRDCYAFAYHITITNHGQHAITLRNRHWEITDALGKIETVDGAGVVGKQPLLMPQESFSYTSGAHLPTPWGHMQGRYEFESTDGARFWADIPQFELKAAITLQ